MEEDPCQHTHINAFPLIRLALLASFPRGEGFYSYAVGKREKPSPRREKAFLIYHPYRPSAQSARGRFQWKVTDSARMTITTSAPRIMAVACPATRHSSAHTSAPARDAQAYTSFTKM